MSSALHLVCQDTFFAIPIEFLVEVLDQVEVDSIPTMSQDVKGVFYYRGKIIPLIDLSFKLFQYKELSTSARVVILQHQGFYTGLYVDQVRMVVEYTKLDTKDVMEANLGDYINGVFDVNDISYYLLNIDKLIGV